MKALIFSAVFLLAIPVYGEDWKTSDGKTYEDIKVIKVEADAITIIYKEGGALVPLAKLPPAIQTKFAYDPVKAKEAADARAKATADNSKALQAEIVQGDKMKQDRIKTEEQARSASMTNQAPQ